MDLYTKNLDLLYQKYDELMEKNLLINKKMEKKQKEQNRKEASMQILNDKLAGLKYVEDVLRGKYKKEDKKLKLNILKIIFLPVFLAIMAFITLLFHMPGATWIIALLLLSSFCATNYIMESINKNVRPLRERKMIKNNYEIDAVLVEIFDLANTIKDQKKDMMILEDEQNNLHSEKEKIGEMIDLVDEVISRLQEAKESVIWHLTHQSLLVEDELNKSFQNNKNVLKLIKKIEKEEV